MVVPERTVRGGASMEKGRSEPGRASASGEGLAVTVELFAPLSDRLGASSLEVGLAAGATVGDLLRRLAANYPAFRPFWPAIGEPAYYPFLVVNGSSLSLPAGLDRGLKHGDRVGIVPPIAGGSRR